MTTLTLENIKLGMTIKNQYGNWLVSKDCNGWVISGRSGSKMLFEYDFQYYEVV